MSENAKITTPMRWDVVHNMKNGNSIRETSSIVNLPKTTVHNIWTKYLNTNHVKDLPRSGRPRKIDSRDVREILRNVQMNPRDPVKVLKQKFNHSRTDNKQVSRQTIQKILEANSIISRTLSVKWKISPVNIKKRLEWAKEHVFWKLQDWDKVVFTDESSVQNKIGLRKIRVRRGSDIPAHHFIHKNKWDLKIMVWGYITSSSERGLVFIQETITGESYKKLLENKLYDALPGLFQGELIYQQDNAPAHREKGVLEYFDSNGIELLNWPPQSPDLNIIEDCWRYLKRRLKEHYEEESDLKKDIIRIWSEIPSEFISKLYRSIPRRLASVMKAKGLPSKY